MFIQVKHGEEPIVHPSRLRRIGKPGRMTIRPVDTVTPVFVRHHAGSSLAL